MRQQVGKALSTLQVGLWFTQPVEIRKAKYFGSFALQKLSHLCWASKSEKFFILKRAYNNLSLFGSGLINYLKDAYEEPEAIVVFGSYSRGKDISQSDIDIVVATKKEAQLDLNEFEKHLKRKISL
jgi:hypothetical protein